MNKITILSLMLIFINVSSVVGCELCKRNQPKILENITHGAGPTGTIDYIITWSAVVLVTVTLVLNIKFLIQRKETGSDHIKNIVLHGNDEMHGR